MLLRASASFAGTKAVSDPDAGSADTQTEAPQCEWPIAAPSGDDIPPRCFSAPLPTSHTPHPLRSTRTTPATDALAAPRPAYATWVLRNPVRAQINTLHSTVNLPALLSPAPIAHARSAGRPDVLLMDRAARGPDWAHWRDMAPALRDTGLRLPAQRRVMVRVSSHAMMDLTAALPWMQRSAREGRFLSEPLFSGASREDLEAVLAVLRLGLCDPTDAGRLLFDMAARATEASAPGVPLALRLQRLAQVFEDSHPVGTPPRAIRTTPLCERHSYLSRPDAWGRTAHTLATQAGNTAMLLALRAATHSPRHAQPERTHTNP